MTDSTIAGFLNRLRPGGIHCLTSIIPDGKTTTKSFTDPDAAALWATTRNAAGENVYFHINPPLKALTRKASKTDIARVEFLHVDVDPRVGEDIAAEQKRIRDLLTDDRPKDIPEPTLIVFSGNGYQAMWRLAEPILIDGDVTKAADAERYTRQLEEDFKADNTHNVDRLLRLPFTVNLPNKKKRAKGRAPTDAKVICWADDAPHPLAFFKQAPPLAGAAGEKASCTSKARRAAIGPAVVGPMGTAELEAWATANGKTITDRTLALIASGDTDDEYGGDRSKMVFRVAGDLIRAGVPDDLICAVLIDSNNPVSAHVRDQKGNLAQYAQRQIDRAREQEIQLPQSGNPVWDRVTKEGEPVYTFHNAIEALKMLGVEFRSDDFRGQKVIGDDHGLQEYSGVLTDLAEVFLRREIRLRFGFDVKRDSLHEAVTELCALNHYDSLCDHLNALPAWDGTLRLDTWLVNYCGAADTRFTREAGAIWLTAAVVRAFRPGAKFDYMLILVGEQGIKKSAALRVIASGELDGTCTDRFSDAPLLGAKDGREILELSGGVWIQECAELDGIGKKDVSALKAMIVRTQDKGRLVWSRIPVEVPRRFVMAGTTNERRFLQDSTGNRRFWPVDVTQIDLERLAYDRDQILAEAVDRYRAGSFRLWLTNEAEAEAKNAQGERAVVDEGYREILEFMKAEGEYNGQPYVTTESVYRRLDIDRRNRAGTVAHKVRAAMRSLGWRPVDEVPYVAGKKQRVYVWNGKGARPEIETNPF